METITIQIPSTVYVELEAIAAEEQSDPITVLTALIKNARYQRTFSQLWQELVEQVRRDGGLNVGATVDEIVDQMRTVREDIFEAEYAHLYR
jgi:hypothetical protein